MQALRYVLCDVFTDRPLTGNPLCVFTDARELDTATMQALARELNLSETVFVLPAEQGGHARLRIFTPRRELPFAGHPTLGAAFVIGTSVQLEVLGLETGKGLVAVRLEREASQVSFGWMQQPIPSIHPFADKNELLSALGLTRSLLPVEVYDNGIRHVLVMVETPSVVSNLAPDLTRLGKLGVETVSIFCGAGKAWKTRVFAPGAGVAEDPATGSAAGPLAVHLARHGLLAFDRTVRIHQGEELHRPSELMARVAGNSERLESVEVGGAAVILARGEFRRWAPSA